MDLSEEIQRSDQIIDQLISQYDETGMPVPDIECQPHLLISKVRKHYMEYLIKLLAVNYETNQKLLNKNIYLPSAIWRCAKNIETAAAQMCMVVQLYRQNLLQVVKELKNDTKKGKLNKKLYECLHNPPVNEKKMQTNLNLTEDCTCECHCKSKKKRRKVPSPNSSQVKKPASDVNMEDKITEINEQNKIPVLINSQVEQPLINCDVKDSFCTNTTKEQAMQNPCQPSIINTARMSLESQDSDDLMLQLEKLFQADPNDDDLFDGAFSNDQDAGDTSKNNNNENNHVAESLAGTDTGNIGDSILQNHSLQIRSLDERLASLAGLLATNNESNSTPVKSDTPKPRKPSCSKWFCEEYYLKSSLFGLLDEIGDSNRKKLIRIKESLRQIFGDDSDDEGVLSPLEETPEFLTSCKERIAPWVVKLLTPYYIKGRIRGKALFKSLAKHLIRLIYQCSHYPSEYEVKSFVIDFLESHKMIRCEADFKQFRIENLNL
ncbi:hypothetical protein NE865_02044 [Phthorimaea operculella]|nr:hypothetical protein NE865_02044 [Phthorimaea operculella]